jgi:RNA polymerase sigma-70 factor (ECF subfamily)
MSQAGTMERSSYSVPPEQVVQELSEPLRRYLQRYSGSHALADDLLQETLIRVVHGLPSFEGRASVKTWAFSIATRVAAGHFRKPANRAQIVEFDECAEVSDPKSSVGQELITGEMNACIRQVIDSLPEDYRAALVLHDLEGLTAVQIAEVCGCSAATAKIRIHRARLRLKETLQQECDFYRDSENVLRCDRKCDE